MAQDAAVCPHCSEPIRDDSYYCGSCGKAVAPSERPMPGRKQTMLGVKLREEMFNGVPNALFPYEQKVGVGGALFCDGKRKPASGGAVVYLPATDGVEKAAARAKKAGGTVVLEKLDIGDPGFIAVVLDTEGNTIGLHTPRA